MKPKVQVTYRPCPTLSCEREFTYVVWPDPMPPQWLEHDCFSVMSCPDCGSRLDG